MSILLHVLKRYLTYNKKNYIGYLKNEEDHDIKKVDNNNNYYYLNNNLNDNKEKEKDTKDEKKNKKKNKMNYTNNNDNEIIGNNNNNNTNINEIKIYNNTFINNDYLNYNNILKNNRNHLTNKKNVKVKTIYFIRHSESVWNSVFNKEMSTKQFLKMFMVILYELVFLFSKKSALIDSPLSNTGIIQSIELSNFLLEGRTDFNDEFCDETFNHIEYINDKTKTNDNTINNKDEYVINNNNSIDLYKLSKKKLKKNKNSISTYNKKQENKDILTINNNNYSHDNSNDNHNIQEEQENILQNVKNYITYDNDNNYSNKRNYNYRNDEYNHEEIINLNLKDHIDILNNNKYDSVLLCSDLRRTISSCFISFYNRINKYNEDIYVLNSLQEISRNPDCVPLMKYYNKYVTTDIEKFLHKDVEKLFRKNIKFNKNFTRNSFLDTLDYIFNHEKNIFIIFGHSLWFLHFFKYFLKESHKAKTNKLKNASVIVFNILKYENDDQENDSFKVEQVIQNDHINQDQNTPNEQQQHYNTHQEQYNTQQEHYNTQQEQYNTHQEKYNTHQEQYNHDTNDIYDTEYLTHEDLTENSDYLSSYTDYEEDVTKADEQENYYENHNDDIVLQHVDNLQHIRHMRNSDNSYEQEPLRSTTKEKKKLKLKNPKRKHKLHKKNKKNKIFVNEKVKYEVDQNSIRVLYKGFDEK